MPRSDEEMREYLSESLEQLLLNCPPEQREREMSEVERLLLEANLPAGSPRRDSPALFASDLFRENPGTYPLVAQAQSRHPQQDWNPVENVAGPADLVASLLPSDHHLE